MRCAGRCRWLSAPVRQTRNKKTDIIVNSDIRKLIHAFRNALVMAADTKSHECFQFHRWSELNSFPNGCCDLASNFLAKYLNDKGHTAEIIFVNNGLDDKEFSDMQGHVFVRLNSWHIDLTLCQFDNFNCRIRIEDCRTGTLRGLIRRNRAEDTTRTAVREVNLDDACGSGLNLYRYVCNLADGLLAGKPYEEGIPLCIYMPKNRHKIVAILVNAISEKFQKENIPVRMRSHFLESPAPFMKKMRNKNISCAETVGPEVPTGWRRFMLYWVTPVIIGSFQWYIPPINLRETELTLIRGTDFEQNQITVNTDRH